jgi:hypothetical protein
VPSLPESSSWPRAWALLFAQRAAPARREAGKLWRETAPLQEDSREGRRLSGGCTAALLGILHLSPPKSYLTSLLSRDYPRK